MSQAEIAELRETVKTRYRIATALSTQDIRMYLPLISHLDEPISPIRLAILQNNLTQAVELLEGPPCSKDPFFDEALVLLAQPQGKDAFTREILKASFLEEMGSRRHEAIFQQMIEGEIPFDMNLIRKAGCDPESKRILVYLAAKWMPDHAEELNAFARQLDFPCDEISLCLKKIASVRNLSER